jgi:hypothetical protein
VKLRDLERHLTAHGARKVAEGSKHSKWRSADGSRASAVPRHREIGPGLRHGNQRRLVAKPVIEIAPGHIPRGRLFLPSSFERPPVRRSARSIQGNQGVRSSSKG